MQVLKVGVCPPFYVHQLGLMFGFYMANWEEYHTHILRSNYKGIGLTECQLFLIGILFLQSFSGGTMSEMTLRNLGMMVLPSINETHV